MSPRRKLGHLHRVTFSLFLLKLTLNFSQSAPAFQTALRDKRSHAAGSRDLMDVQTCCVQFAHKNELWVESRDKKKKKKGGRDNKKKEERAELKGK